MLTIILPGNSPHNKKWAEETKENLKVSGDITVFEWNHWIEGNSFSISKDQKKIVEIAGSNEINIIAKSLGSRVAMNLVLKLKDQINKLILCGVAHDPSKIAESYNTLPADKVLVIQNSKDPFNSYAKIKEKINSINDEIVILEKEANNHEYYYFDEFNGFLNR